MEFNFAHRKEFGKDRLYPTNTAAKLLLRLMRHQSLTIEQALECRACGWTINIDYVQVKVI